MLNSDLFKIRITNLGFPTKSTEILTDFMRQREAYVEINGKSSDLFNIILGCIQGSILGPIIFSIFVRPLNEIENDLTSYADDTYGLIKLKPHDTCKQNFGPFKVVKVLWNDFK